MPYETIEYTIAQNGVASLVLNRPDIHNAINETMINEVQSALDDINNNEKVRALLLKGNGKNFCAGADLNWMKKMVDYDFESNKKDALELAHMFQKLDQCSKPTICVINGAAYGGAMGFISSCDLAFCEAESKFCLSEVKLGLTPATISPYVVRAMGTRQARRYFLSAEVFTASKAKEINLVHEICDNTEQLEDSAKKIAELMCNNGPKALSITKKLIEEVNGASIGEDLNDLTSSRIADIRVSPEGQEGLKAFLEKRSPEWQHSE